MLFIISTLCIQMLFLTSFTFSFAMLPNYHYSDTILPPVEPIGSAGGFKHISLLSSCPLACASSAGFDGFDDGSEELGQLCHALGRLLLNGSCVDLILRRVVGAAGVFA